MTDGARYEVVVTGRLSPRILHAFPGFEVLSEEGGHTRLQGWVVDQAALQGLVRTLGDLCVPIESIQRLDRPD